MNGTITSTKTEHPADASGRWTVTGEAGKVEYDSLGPHLKLIPTIGDADAVMGRTLARVGEYARLDDDEAVFLILENLYYSELKYAAVTR